MRSTLPPTLVLLVLSCAAFGCNDGVGAPGSAAPRLRLTPDSSRAALNARVVFRADVVDGSGQPVADAAAPVYTLSDTALAALEPPLIGPGILALTRRAGVVEVRASTVYRGERLVARGTLVIDPIVFAAQ